MLELIRKVFKKGKPRSKRSKTEPYDIKFKTKIIKQYLKGDVSYAMLGRQYGLHPGIISRWLRVIKNGRVIKKQQGKKITKFTGMSKKIKKKPEELVAENALLKKQLEEAQLKVELYKKVIEIAERDYKLDIIKKYAARRSTKSGK